MIDRRARCAPLLVLSLASTLGLAACNGGAGAKPTETKPTETKKAPPEDEAKDPTRAEPAVAEPDPEPEPNDAAAQVKVDAGAAAEGGDSPTPDGAAGAEGEAAGAEEEGGGDEAAAQAAGEGGAAGGEESAAEGGDASGKDSAALLKEARTTKTPDARALEALAEAETAGATAKELARAAKARADYLYKDPDRAKVFYEWSAAKDEDYPDPVFALAKQKAVTGDVEDVVKLLKQVSERKGGKKLLEQLDFDPTWDIVKDDPEVRALL